MVLFCCDAVPVYLGGELLYVPEFDLRTQKIDEFDPHFLTVDIAVKAEYVRFSILRKLANTGLVADICDRVEFFL